MMLILWKVRKLDRFGELALRKHLDLISNEQVVTMFQKLDRGLEGPLRAARLLLISQKSHAAANSCGGLPLSFCWNANQRTITMDVTGHLVLFYICLFFSYTPVDKHANVCSRSVWRPRTWGIFQDDGASTCGHSAWNPSFMTLTPCLFVFNVCMLYVCMHILFLRYMCKLKKKTGENNAFIGKTRHPVQPRVTSVASWCAFSSFWTTRELYAFY